MPRKLAAPVGRVQDTDWAGNPLLKMGVSPGR